MTSTSPRTGMRVRKLLAAAHLWLGLTLGFVWALQGLTGAVLVFHGELDRLVLPAPQDAAPLTLDRLVAATTKALPRPPESIGVLDSDASILVVNYSGSDGARRGQLVDAATGTILHDRDWRPSSPAGGNAARWLYDLHHHLLAGGTGGYLLGASGLLLLASTGWGLWLAWPRRDHWKAALDFRRWKPRAQRLHGWHRAIGLCAALGLALLGLNGAMMDYGKPLRQLSERYLPYRPPHNVPAGSLQEHPIGADRALAAARARLPQGTFVSLALPSPKLPAYQVRMRQPGEWRSWSGTSMVTVNPANGTVVDVYDASTAPLANRLRESAFAVHSGEVAGMAGRLAVFLAGLSLPALYVLGVWGWLRRRRRGGAITTSNNASDNLISINASASDLQ